LDDQRTFLALDIQNNDSINVSKDSDHFARRYLGINDEGELCGIDYQGWSATRRKGEKV
jgi:hypothetical protein